MIVAGHYSVRQAEAMTQQALAAPAPRQEARQPVSPETAALARMLSEKLGLNVRISFDGRRGAVTIPYENLDQLDGIIALLNPGQHS